MSDLIRRCMYLNDPEPIQSLYPYPIIFDVIRDCTSGTRILKCLLSSMKINVNCKNFDGDSPLHVAVRWCRVEAVKLLLSENADMTCRNNLGVTPMFEAFRQTHTQIINILLDQGQQIDPYKKYYQVCRLVFEKSILNLIQFFSENKDVDIDFKALMGVESPLLLAVADRNFDMVYTLVTKGADVNYRKGYSGMSALHAALEYDDIIVDFLLDYDANVNCYLSYESLITPLHYAVKAPGEILTKMLLKKGALVNLLGKDEAFTSALHFAAEGGEIEKNQLLIDSGAYIDQVNENGDTPLLLAVRKRHLDVIKLLLENKANPNIANNKGNTVLFEICDWPNKPARLELIKKIISHGADTDAQNNDGITVFHNACIKAYDFAEFLLKEGFDPDVNCTNKVGHAPITTKRNYEISCQKFILLLRYGADINIGFDSNYYVPMPSKYSSINYAYGPFNNLNCPVYAHFEKLKLLGYNVNEVLWSKYQKSVCRDHPSAGSGIKIADFEIELEQLKTTTIYFNPKKTLYDILFMKQDRITTSSSNVELKNLYRRDNDNFENSYPHYGWLLNLQYRRGQRRRKLMYSVVEELKTALELNELDLWSFILRYLKNADLKFILRSKHN